MKSWNPPLLRQISINGATTILPYHQFASAFWIFPVGRVNFLFNRATPPGWMKHMAERLESHGFRRIHRSFLVNFEKVEALQKSQVRVGEVWLPVGEAYRWVGRSYQSLLVIIPWPAAQLLPRQPIFVLLIQACCHAAWCSTWCLRCHLLPVCIVLPFPLFLSLYLSSILDKVSIVRRLKYSTTYEIQIIYALPTACQLPIKHIFPNQLANHQRPGSRKLLFYCWGWPIRLCCQWTSFFQNRWWAQLWCESKTIK